MPDALVRDLLMCAERLSESVLESVGSIVENRESLRTEANGLGIIRRKADLDVPREPSVVGIDGSYNVAKLAAVEVAACAALAVEGVVQETRRHWEQPYHRFWAGVSPHGEDTTLLLRGIMVSQEVELAAIAPHDLVLLDGSFTSLVIYVNQALSNLRSGANDAANELTRRREEGLFEQLLELIQSNRTVAVPKFTSRNEFRQLGFGDFPAVDGKTMATFMLEPGEYTSPLNMNGADDRPFHISGLTTGQNQNLDAAVRQLQVIYFRPYGWAPALRLEVPSSVATSNNRLSVLLEGISRQFFSPSVTEPFPLFMADRMVKSLGAGLQVLEQSVVQHVAYNASDLELAMICMQNYRTEGGRG